jgi:hypothetical protein
MLDVIEGWLRAINAGDARAAAALSQEQIVVVGPRGRGPMPSAALGEWLARSGFSARPTRWFCGGDGRAVVELEARWKDSPETLTIGTLFRVTEGRVAEFERFDSGVSDALAAAAMREDRDEVALSR